MSADPSAAESTLAWHTWPKGYGVNGWTLPLLCPRRTVPGSIPDAPADDPGGASKAGSPLWPCSKRTLIPCSSRENHAAKQAWIQLKRFQAAKEMDSGPQHVPHGEIRALLVKDWAYETWDAGEDSLSWALFASLSLVQLLLDVRPVTGRD